LKNSNEARAEKIIEKYKVFECDDDNIKMNFAAIVCFHTIIIAISSRKKWTYKKKEKKKMSSTQRNNSSN